MNPANFVSDGRERALSGLRQRIRQDVQSEFADRLSSAGWMRRMSLRLEMHWVIGRRLCQAARTSAPRGGLYLQANHRQQTAHRQQSMVR